MGVHDSSVHDTEEEVARLVFFKPMHVLIYMKVNKMRIYVGAKLYSLDRWNTQRKP